MTLIFAYGFIPSFAEDTTDRKQNGAIVQNQEQSQEQAAEGSPADQGDDSDAVIKSNAGNEDSASEDSDAKNEQGKVTTQDAEPTFKSSVYLAKTSDETQLLVILLLIVISATIILLGRRQNNKAG